MESVSAENKIKALLKTAENNPEQKIHSLHGIFKIDLKLENIRLWKETLNRYSEPYNLLLACEKEDCEFKDTNLTWVVGAAIRPFLSKSPIEAIKMLQLLGVKSGLTQIASEHCPGLGTEITWAFYLDRHGWLSASPAIDLPIRKLST